ncbi:MAG TPA: hypothetical protein DCZ94_00540 [Lentisphaeria bacterium]|nr:MAG: hypothetical protein A2X48_12100 [Lentisphaerae bacterium GWF2_49_21]HBC85419.1 hypothetical protein [Lentisphaeria bacterium]
MLIFTSALLAVSVIAGFALAVLLMKTKKSLAASESGFKTVSDELKKQLSELDGRNKISEDKCRTLEESIRKLEDKTGKLTKENIDSRTLLEEREKQIENLRAALKPDSFDGFFPICSNCKDIRDPKGYWHSIEEYIQGLSKSDFSHSLCPECAKKLYPDLFDGENKAICLKWSSGSNKPM